MTDQEFVEKLTKHFKDHAKLFSPGNNWVLGHNNSTAEHLSRWVVEFLKEEDIKF